MMVTRSTRWLVPSDGEQLNPTKMGSNISDLLEGSGASTHCQQHSHLLESDVLRVLPEALTAEVQSILSNDAVVV